MFPVGCSVFRARRINKFLYRSHSVAEQSLPWNCHWQYNIHTSNVQGGFAKSRLDPFPGQHPRHRQPETAIVCMCSHLWLARLVLWLLIAVIVLWNIFDWLFTTTFAMDKTRVARTGWPAGRAIRQPSFPEAPFLQVLPCEWNPVVISVIPALVSNERLSASVEMCFCWN